MIDPAHELPIVWQAQLPDLSRWSIYYQPQPISDADLALMRRIDEPHLEHPFAGSQMSRDLLNREGLEVGRKHVSTLMRRMGIGIGHNDAKVEVAAFRSVLGPDLGSLGPEVVPRPAPAVLLGAPLNDSRPDAMMH